jgi:hypothetical protein
MYINRDGVKLKAGAILKKKFTVSKKALVTE